MVAINALAGTCVALPLSVHLLPTVLGPGLYLLLALVVLITRDSVVSQLPCAFIWGILFLPALQVFAVV